MNDLFNSYEELKKKLYIIRCRNWIKCNYNGNGKFGLQLEHLLGKKIDRYILPDYKNIELKTKNINNKNNYGIKMFSCSFNNKPKETERFLNEVGYCYKGFKTYQRSVNTFNGRIFEKGYLKIKVYRDSHTIKLLLYKNKQRKNYTYFVWTFDELKLRLETKMKYLLIVYYDIKYINNNIYVKYVHHELFKLKSFEDFLVCVEKGYITICFNLKEEKIDDKIKIINKGTGFEIKWNNIHNLFEQIQ